MIAFLRNLLAVLALTAFAVYVLHSYHTLAGLVVGTVSVSLALAIAIPMQLQQGVVALKGSLVLIVPVIADALKGGSRKTDPNADGTPKGDV